MAEILWLQRGNHRATDDFERFLDGQLFMFERTHHVPVPAVDKDGKPIVDDKGNPVFTNQNQKVQYALQGGRREYKIVGYAVPDDRVDEVLNGLNIGDGNVGPKQAALAVATLRKAMGAEKIPPRKDRGTSNRVIPREGVGVYMIGVKRDKSSTWQINGQEFTQENI